MPDVIGRRSLFHLGGAGMLAAMSGGLLTAPASAASWSACLADVSREHPDPPAGFLDTLLTWGKAEQDVVFAPNSRADIYSNLYPVLGPWQSALHRRAVMLEALRVLAAFESDWNWNAGRASDNPYGPKETEETGAFQVSFNSMVVDTTGSCRSYAQGRGVAGSMDLFISTMKSDHVFACGYIARLLRFSINENSPVRDGDVRAHVSRAAVEEFRSRLSSAPTTTTLPNLYLGRDGGNAGKALKGWLHAMYTSTSSPLGAACVKIDPSNGFVGTDTWAAMQEFCRHFGLLTSTEPLTTWGPRCWATAQGQGFNPTAWGAYG